MNINILLVKSGPAKTRPAGPVPPPLHTQTYMYIHTHIHTRVHTHTHTHTHTHMHIHADPYTSLQYEDIEHLDGWTYNFNQTHTCVPAIVNCAMCSLMSSVCWLLPLQAAQEHYDLIRADYQKEVQKLTKLVDGAVDSVDFIAASGQSTY